MTPPIEPYAGYVLAYLLMGLMVITTLYLWQSARAIQRLKEQHNENT